MVGNYIDSRELARLLGVSEDTIRRMARRNEIPHIRLGIGGRRRYRFRRESIEKWLTEQERGRRPED